jgi:hypothetical protein
VKEEMRVLEEVVWEDGKLTENEKIVRDFEVWFSNSDFSKRKNTKVFEATKHYWLTKDPHCSGVGETRSQI